MLVSDFTFNCNSCSNGLFAKKRSQEDLWNFHLNTICSFYVMPNQTKRQTNTLNVQFPHLYHLFIKLKLTNHYSVMEDFSFKFQTNYHEHDSKGNRMSLRNAIPFLRKRLMLFNINHCQIRYQTSIRKVTVCDRLFQTYCQQLSQIADLQRFRV